MHQPSCSYITLVQRPHCIIQWCNDCQTFQIIYNNIVLCFPPKEFENFKETVAECYMHHLEWVDNRDRRQIFFNTPVIDMHFLFSTNEVGELLGLLQDAELEFMMIDQAGEAHSDA
ncbi:MAG: DUF6686 family protein [Bacteroidota bacterium]